MINEEWNKTQNDAPFVAFYDMSPSSSPASYQIMVEWCFMPLSTVFQSYHSHSSHYSCLSWVSPVLRWGSEVSCPRTLPRKNPEDPVRLEPRTPGLRVKHFTTEPRRTPPSNEKHGLSGKMATRTLPE